MSSSEIMRELKAEKYANMYKEYWTQYITLVL